MQLIVEDEEVGRRAIRRVRLRLEHLLVRALKNFPNTSFMAMKHAAMPPPPAMNSRRLTPSFLEAPSTSSLSRCSTRR